MNDFFYLHHRCVIHPIYFILFYFFRYGRRRTTQLPVVLALIFGIVAGLSRNLYFYLVSQFIIAATLGGYRINSIVLGRNFMSLFIFFKEWNYYYYFFFLTIFAIDSACSDRMDWGQQKIIGRLFESGVCGSGAVCHSRPDLHRAWLEDSPVYPGRVPGLCAALHLVRLQCSFYLSVTLCCIWTSTHFLIMPY